MYTIQHYTARLYNYDETCITIVKHKHTKIFELKGKRQISSVQSAEQGFLVTVVNCMVPNEHFIPPLFVFLRKYMKPELMNGTPPGSILAHLPSEWIQGEIFSQWFLNFIKHTKPTKRSFYLSTGRAIFTHKKLELPTLARENHVDIFASHLTTVTKCNAWIKLSWGP